LQRHFPIYNILLQFEDIGNKGAKSQTLNEFFSSTILGGLTPKLDTEIFMLYGGHITWKNPTYIPDDISQNTLNIWPIFEL